MERKSIRHMISIEDVLNKESGWYEEILYDGDFNALQDDLQVDKQVKSYLFLIYPIVIAQK